MKLKLDDDGHAVLEDGKPVYIYPDGKEAAFDAEHTVNTITKLNGEAKGHREAKESAEKERADLQKRLEAYGDLDPESASKAVQTMKNLDDKKLVDAGEVEKVKEEVKKAMENEYKPYVERSEKLENQLRQERIGGAFARSKFIGEKMAIPADMVQARFGSNFKMEEGGVVAYDGDGNAIYSRSKPGEKAGFEEALEILVDQYPYKDNILKSSGASGSGASQSNGGRAGEKTMTRAQWDHASQGERMEFSKKGGRVVD